MQPCGGREELVGGWVFSRLTLCRMAGAGITGLSPLPNEAERPSEVPRGAGEIRPENISRRPNVIDSRGPARRGGNSPGGRDYVWCLPRGAMCEYELGTGGRRGASGGRIEEL
jgi:hypothetical protein